VQHGSLRRASERLHVSQPALSEAVGKLERELGVTLLDRHRSGSRISATGRDLLGGMSDVLDAVDRLRAAAGHHRGTPRAVRVGTVTTGSSAVVAPAVHAFQDARPATAVEVLDLQQSEIHQGVTDGALDLGLVNVLAGDDLPVGLASTLLLHGSPVVVLPVGHRLASRDRVDIADLRGERFIGMRAGYLMHRVAERLFGPEPPTTTYSADGAAMGKLLVADGLGVTLLPDYSVVGDPLERAGLITSRPLSCETATVSLVLLERRHRTAAPPVRELREALVERARAYAART
jgi:DNA-binding transcriptional LysR family regulator